MRVSSFDGAKAIGTRDPVRDPWRVRWPSNARRNGPKTQDKNNIFSWSSWVGLYLAEIASIHAGTNKNHASAGRNTAAGTHRIHHVLYIQGSLLRRRYFEWDDARWNPTAFLCSWKTKILPAVEKWKSTQPDKLKVQLPATWKPYTYLLSMYMPGIEPS